MLFGIILGLTLIISGVLPNFSYIIIPIGIGIIALMIFTRLIGKWWVQRKVGNLVALCKDYISTDKGSDASKNLILAVSTLEKAIKDGDVAKELRSYRNLKRAWKNTSSSSTEEKSKKESWKWGWKIFWLIVIAGGSAVFVFQDELFPPVEVIIGNELIEFPSKKGDERVTLYPGYTYTVRFHGTWSIHDPFPAHGTGFTTINCSNGSQPVRNEAGLSNDRPHGKLPYSNEYGSAVALFDEQEYSSWSEITPVKAGSLKFGVNVPHENNYHGRSRNTGCKVTITRTKRVAWW